MTTDDFQGDPDPAHGSQPFFDGGAAGHGFTRSPNSRYAANHYYRPGQEVPGLEGLTGQPISPWYWGENGAE
jgi:hypothetical protein